MSNKVSPARRHGPRRGKARGRGVSGRTTEAGAAEASGERRQLLNVAYRLLGSLAEAEDAVQEAYARWYALPDPRRDEIASPGAWLT
ncbi:sigma factor, partial [Streptomyces sp. M10]|uniref:sigma factor n=1 Tax=Streptomyces sp. M10 TaxID=412968 RepID=UPI0038D0A9BF